MHPAIETLEPRIAPAAVLNPSAIQYRDIDGDLVTLKFSKPVLALASDNGVKPGDLAHFSSGGFDDSTATPQALTLLDLTVLAGKLPAGISITLTAKRDPLHGGDGFAGVDEIRGAKTAFGSISIDGNLGQITSSGDPALGGGVAIKLLHVHSFGSLDLLGQFPIQSTVTGKTGVLHIDTDMRVAEYFAASDAGLPGDLGAVKVGGSLLKASVGGIGNLGPVSVAGDVRGGDAPGLGGVGAGGSIAGVKIGGSLIGGSSSFTGSINAGTKLGPVSIRGDLVGGSTETGLLSRTGFIGADQIASVTIGGSIYAGSGLPNGKIDHSGAIAAGHDLGAVTVKGNIVGTFDAPVSITAGGALKPTVGSDLAIKSVTVGGSVVGARILAGYDAFDNEVDGRAQIGAVKIARDFIGATIAAGIDPGMDKLFGTADDLPIGNVTEPTARIASVIVGGMASGTGYSMQDHFGILARQIGAVKVGGNALKLHPGPDNDSSIADPLLALGVTGDLRIREVPAVP